MSAACSIDTIRGSHLPRCDLVKYVDASGFLEFESGPVGIPEAFNTLSSKTFLSMKACHRMPPVPCQPPFCLSLTSPCMRLCVCYAGAPLCVLLSLQPCETCGVLTFRFAIVVATRVLTPHVSPVALVILPPMVLSRFSFGY